MESNRLTTKRLSPELVPPWDQLPDDFLLHIFSYLKFQHLATAACVCCSWQRVADDELLWKRVFRSHYSVASDIGLAEGRLSWKGEFKRLYSESPAVHLQTVTGHTDQVLHVSFSRNGKMFATSSKDGFIKVWDANHPVSLRYYKNMVQFSWKYTQFSQFNQTDTLLLVSGVYFGDSSTVGEVAIFSLTDPDVFELQCRVKNKPYDVFGTWYSDKYLLSGDLEWLNIFNGPDIICSCSTVSLNYAFQATESEQHSVVSRLFKFKNINSSTIRTLMVADLSRCKPATNAQSVSNSALDSDSNVNCDSESESGAPTDNVIKTSSEKFLVFTKGDKTYSPHVIGIKRLPDYDWAQASGMRAPPSAESVNYRDLLDSDFDQLDYGFDMNGHIIGLGLSPDHRYLYANVRAWPANAEITDPHRPPPIAQQIDIRVIDLLTLTQTKHVYRSHRAFTPDDDCFFIFLDVSNFYLASGAEDRHAYLWERHYGRLLATFPHDDVVNSVAFSPRDQETLVTVSDDFSIKIWTSRNRKKRLRSIPDGDSLFCDEMMNVSAAETKSMNISGVAMETAEGDEGLPHNAQEPLRELSD